MTGIKGRSGQKPKYKKLPESVESILEEINNFGIKERFLEKYKVSDVSLEKFLKRRGYRLIHRKTYSLQKLSKEKD